MNSLVLIGSGCLICLMPLALYLLFLSYLNQRSQSTMISGPWDFGCVLLGLSGFILVGGPTLLSIVDASWRGSLFGGDFNHIRAAWGANSVVWSRLAVAYAAVLGAIIVFFMFLRTKMTIIYNVDSSSVEEALNVAIKRSGLGYRRIIGGIEITARQPNREVVADDAGGQISSAQKVTPPSVLAGGLTAVVQIEPFPSLCHAALRWRDDHPLVRAEVEGALAKVLQTREAPANSIAGWFMTASICIFVVMLLWMSFLIYQLFVARNGV